MFCVPSFLLLGEFPCYYIFTSCHCDGLIQCLNKAIINTYNNLMGCSILFQDILNKYFLIGDEIYVGHDQLNELENVLNI